MDGDRGDARAIVTLPTLEPAIGVAIGVDGCRCGWLAVSLCDDGVASWGVFAGFEEVLVRWPEGRILVDMPIGLADDAPRAVEREARQRLGRGRASSVFAVPSRAAVYAPNYESACERNRERLGVAISKQAWYLTPKIRELDRLLADDPSRRQRIVEAHPELCFAALAADGVAMAQSKKTDAGQAERYAVLTQHLATAHIVREAILRSTRRADVAPDDVADALVLAVSARMALTRIPADADACAHMVFPTNRSDP
ncbi:MAG: DUF429 domain-containing protein [Pseudomonadota bacterium]